MKSLGKHFRELTAAAFNRYGFAYAELLTRWQSIAGEDIARLSEPERIKWPRHSAEKSGGTLVLRVAPGRALDVQHETARLAERINGFYGYGAIAAIRIVQAPLKAEPAKRAGSSLDGAKTEALDAELAAISDPALKAALRRLGQGALASRTPDE